MSQISDLFNAKGESITQLMRAPSDGWIQTFTGGAIWPMNPADSDVRLLDIAHALSMICRYTGHVREFYSVAQHSVIVSRVVPPTDAKWGLLHDATEAYLCDVARPVKHSMPAYKAIEAKLEQVIARVFALPLPMPASIKHADLVMLATERRDLMARPPYLWTSTENIEPLQQKITPWCPAEAKAQFLRRAEELGVLS